MTQTPPNPLATAEPWNLVSAAYTAEILPLFELFSRDALARADLPPTPRIVDVATGPGTLALMAAADGARVSAIDFSPDMLTRLRARAAPDLLTRIELVQGDGQKLPFASEAYDSAFSMFGLIFFPDRIAGFRELRRVLKPGRKAIVSSWAPFEGAFEILMSTVRENVPGIPFGQGQAPLGKREDYVEEMTLAGFSLVTVETVGHMITSPSVEDFWGNVQRTNVAIILLRRKLGEATWAKTGPAIFEKLKGHFGNDPIAVSARAHLGIGVR
jgi:SAM-dependent methyltransferase